MSIEERGKALEEAFFAKKNKELLQQVKQDLDSAKQREALKTATGIAEDEVLDKILAIGVNAESLAAMSIAPMVLVAWADGRCRAAGARGDHCGRRKGRHQTRFHRWQNC